LRRSVGLSDVDLMQMPYSPPGSAKTPGCVNLPGSQAANTREKFKKVRAFAPRVGEPKAGDQQDRSSKTERGSFCCNRQPRHMANDHPTNRGHFDEGGPPRKRLQADVRFFPDNR
jgi:hypothetical protein